MPRFNKQLSGWAIDAIFFPWLGLLLIALSPFWWTAAINEVDVGRYCLELSAYCLLMLRYSGWFGFSWLAAGALTAAGIALNVDNDNLPINLFLWSNAQLLLANFCYRKAEAIALRWQWRQVVSGFAFEWTVRFVLLAYLIGIEYFFGRGINQR